jgi:hypothetical protein
MHNRTWVVAPTGRDTSARPRRLGRIKPTVWEFVLTDAPNAVVTGSPDWHPTVVRAGERLGVIYGPLLVSQVMVAIPQQRAMLRALDKAWMGAVSEAREDGDPGSSRRTIAEAVHFDAVGALGRAVENLHAVVRSIERWRTGDPHPEDTFLAANPDLVTFLASRERRAPRYWSDFVGRPPAEAELIAAGLTDSERNVLSDAYAVSAVALADLHAELAGYYTAELHRFYLRHKHGYALLSPWAGPAIRIAPGPPDPRPGLKKALERGFAVVQLGASPVLAILSSHPEEIRTTIRMAEAALEMSMTIAFSVVYGAGSDRRASMPLVYRQEALAELVSALEKWLGPEPLAGFPQVKRVAIDENAATT